MDWTTMSGLYGDPSDYTTQLRAPRTPAGESHDAAPYFVLAYQYLVTGAKDAAISATPKTVVQIQPKDTTAKRMLDAARSPRPAGRGSGQFDPHGRESSSSGGATDPATPVPRPTRLGDRSRRRVAGEGGDSTIDLSIAEDSKFTWKAVPGPGQAAGRAQGEIGGVGQELILESPEQGAMSGEVKSDGPDKWKFSLTGAPANDPGLTFERAKK